MARGVRRLHRFRRSHVRLDAGRGRPSPGRGDPAVRAGRGQELADRDGRGLERGMVAWLQTHRLLVAHGAESTLPSFLAVAVLVEIGPLLAGLLVAAGWGRAWPPSWARWSSTRRSTPASCWAPTRCRRLVAPRAIACALAVPLLTVIIDASALLGSLAAELAAGSVHDRPVLEQGAGVSQALRHRPRDAQDGGLRLAGGPDRLLDRLERRATRPRPSAAPPSAASSGRSWPFSPPMS